MFLIQGCIIEHGQDIDGIQPEDQTDSQENIDDFTFPDIPEDLALPDETEQVNSDSDDVGPPEQSCLSASETPHEDQACLTIQPDRILCGVSGDVHF